MTPHSTPRHQDRILPAMRAIQGEHGYLSRDHLTQISKSLAVPLRRVQELASYFPHFQLNRPPKVTVRVCRDMACHLAGAAKTIETLRVQESEDLRVEGVSCLGRCDRAPAVCVAISPVGPSEGASREEKQELYFVGATVDDEARSVPANRESVRDGRYPSADWMIDPYNGRSRDYEAVRKVVAARDATLRRTAEMLKDQLGLQADASDLTQVLRALQTKSRAGEAASTPDWVDDIFIQLDKRHADLRGMGGAGIPATQKWRDVRNAVIEAGRRRDDERAFVIVNGDESEPGTFKDRELLLHFPHLVLEAVILAGLVTEATEGFIYIRHEYSEQIAACEAEIHRAEAEGLCGANALVLGRPFPISVFVSPGGYICGEQSALVEAMSDRRGEPRNASPSLATNGLDARPTLVSNVETFAWVPYILLNAGQEHEYAGLGVEPWKGRRFFSVSGDVKRPGVYEVPMGLRLGDLILGPEYCQGISEDRRLKAIAPSGPSGGFLPARLKAGTGLPRNHNTNPEWLLLAKRRGFDPRAQELDILNLDLELNLFRSLSPTQALGAGIIVYHDGRDMAKQAVNALEFFRNESCGKCVPCRVGSQKLATLGANLLAGEINADAWNSELLPIVEELGEAMGLTSICGLGRSVPMPLRTLVEYFPDDMARYLK